MSVAKPFRFFNLDLHIAVIADVTDVLKRLYGDAVEIDAWSISGHTWVFGKSPTPVNVVNGHTWKGLNTEMIERFVATYQRVLSEYDGFIVTHTPVFCRLFESFGKPIVMVNSCRYDQPYCMPGCFNGVELDALNACLQRLHTEGRLIAISNNKADRDYLALGTGIESVHIPSLCLYTGIRHDPSRAKTTRLTLSCGAEMAPLRAMPLLDPKPPSPYRWDDLMNRRGLVLIPYEASTMSLFEHYSSGVPLYLPTKRFLKELIETKQWVFLSYKSHCYWNTGRMQIPSALKDTLSLDWWMDRCDFYDPENMPMLHYFDSWDALRVYTETDADAAGAEMNRWTWLAKRQGAIEAQWRRLVDPLVEKK